MDIDMSALRLLEREREIPLDLLIPTIEQALLVAYHKTPGAFEKARAELDRKSGHVTIWATEIDDDGAPDRRIRGHPGRLRPDRGEHRAADHPAAPPRCRGRQCAGPVQGPRG